MSYKWERIQIEENLFIDWEGAGYYEVQSEFSHHEGSWNCYRPCRENDGAEFFAEKPSVYSEAV